MWNFKLAIYFIQTNPPLYQVNVCFKGWDFWPGNNIVFWSFLGALSWVGGMGKSSNVQELLEYKLHFWPR